MVADTFICCVLVTKKGKERSFVILNTVLETKTIVLLFIITAFIIVFQLRWWRLLLNFNLKMEKLLSKNHLVQMAKSPN